MNRRDLLLNAGIMAGAGSAAALYPGKAGARLVLHESNPPASHPFPEGVDFAAAFAYISRRDYADTDDLEGLIDERLAEAKKALMRELKVN